MKHKHAKSNHTLVFSKWSRKGYAIFASLNREVIIACLSVDICISSLLKNVSIISLPSFFIDNEDSDGCLLDEEINWFESLREQLLTIGVIINTDNPYVNSIESNNNSKPVFCIMQNTGFFNMNR